MSFYDENFGRYKISSISLKGTIDYIHKIKNNIEPNDENIKCLLICYAAILRLYQKYDTILDGVLEENININCYNNLLNGYNYNDIPDYFIYTDDIYYGFNNLIVRILSNKQISFYNYCNNYNDYLKSINKNNIIIICNNKYILLKKYINNNLYDIPIEESGETYLNKINLNQIFPIKSYKITNGYSIATSIIYIETVKDIMVENTIYNSNQLYKIIDLTELIELTSSIVLNNIINTDMNFNLSDGNIYLITNGHKIYLSLTVLLGVTLLKELEHFLEGYNP
jgi:hypothetical protein